MTKELIPELPVMLQQSLCAKCDRCRVIRSGKGSVFLLCNLATEVANWPKYPAQPVSRCPKFEKALPPAE